MTGLAATHVYNPAHAAAVQLNTTNLVLCCIWLKRIERNGMKRMRLSGNNRGRREDLKTYEMCKFSIGEIGKC